MLSEANQVLQPLVVPAAPLQTHSAASPAAPGNSSISRDTPAQGLRHDMLQVRHNPVLTGHVMHMQAGPMCMC